jgi:hypothetical protein
MDALQRLLAIEDLRNLKARYFRFMDTKDWAGLAKVFAPDAVFDLREAINVRDPRTGTWKPPLGGGEMVFRGQDRILEMIQTGVEWRVTVHHGHMGEIEITGNDSARAIWAMADMTIDTASDPALDIRGAGHYHDTYVRLPQGWAIQTTKITRLLLER